MLSSNGVPRLPQMSFLLWVVLYALSMPAQATDTIFEAYEYALENDPELKAAHAAFKAGKEAYTQGRSGILPNAQANIQTNKVRREFASGGLEATDKFNTHGYDISLSQPIFILENWFDFKRGKALSKQAASDFALAQQQLIQRVSNAYFDVLRAKAELSSTEAEEKATFRQLKQVQQQFEVGLIAITDVHEAQAVYDTVRVNRIRAETNLDITLEVLQGITGRSHANVADLRTDYPTPGPVPNNQPDWVEIAKAQSFELKSAQSTVDSSFANYRARFASHAPTVTASANYNNSVSGAPTPGTNLNNSTEVDTTTFSLNVQVPIFTGGFTSSRRREAYHRWVESKDNFDRIHRDVVQNVRNLHRTVTTDALTISAREQAIRSRISALEATRAGFEVGTRNIVDVLESQRALFAAQRDYANARYDYVINYINLKLGSGVLSPDDLVEINQWLAESGESQLYEVDVSE